MPDPSELMAAYDAVLEDQFVGGFLVDRSGELLHSFGVAHQWLRPPAGSMTTKLTELIENPELRAATAAALDATARGESLDRPRVPLPASDTRARLIARPLGALSLVYLRPMLVAAVDVDEVVTELELLRAENARLRQSMRERTADLVSNLEDLAERNAELDRFAHVAAHDLKAPVRAVLSFSEAIGEELDAGHPAHAYLDRVQAAAARMGQLVDSLLRFAASGRGELRIEDVDLEECLDAVRLDLRIEIEERSAEVVSAGLPAVRADPTAIRQLLQNLVANGLKFVDGAPPRVVVSAEIRAEDFVIRVEDNGVGFDPAYADEIFEPFRRLHSTRKFRGSGVGLSICRRIIQRHGGAIWAHSEPGRGASFLFTLPRAA